MKVIEFKNKQYNFYTEWKELKLKESIEVLKIVNTFPKYMIDYYTALVTPNADADKCLDVMTNHDQLKTLPKLYGDIMQHLTEIPNEVIRQWNSLERTYFYNEYMLKFVLGLLFYPSDFESKEITNFEHKGVTYWLPESRKLINNVQPMAYASTMEFTESADLISAAAGMEGGKYELAPNIISILCRPKGEEYDEDVSLKRAEQFLDLRMDIVLEVFFCLTLPYILQGQRDLISSMEEQLKEAKQWQVVD